MFIKLITLVLLAGSLALAQSGRVRKNPPGPTQPDDQGALKLRVEEVLLPVSIRSDTGQLPPRLDLKDLVVIEDERHQQVTSVMRTPANVLLLLDASGEAGTPKNTNLHRDLAFRLIEALGEEDKAAVVTYADRVEQVAGWTGDKGALRKALNWKFRPGIKSQLYEGLSFAAGEVLPRVEGRRSVVIFTDGLDASAPPAYNRALAALHRARATVYVVSQAMMIQQALKPTIYNPLAWYEMLDAKVRQRYTHLRQYDRRLETGRAVLRQLTEETGGQLWDPEARIVCGQASRRAATPYDLNPPAEEKTVACDALCDKVIEEIGAEYLVAYLSERKPDDHEFHKVSVLPIRKDLKVRARRGVYAGPPSNGAKQ